MFVELYLQNLNNLLFLMLTGPLQGSGRGCGREKNSLWRVSGNGCNMGAETGE